MTNYEINRALINRLKAMPNAPILIEENTLKKDDKLPKAAIFLVVDFMPIDTQEPTYCGAEIKTGLFQVAVVVPRNGSGSKAAQQKADEVAAHFKRWKQGGLVVTRRVIEQAVESGEFYQIPISIYYQFTG